MNGGEEVSDCFFGLLVWDVRGGGRVSSLESISSKIQSYKLIIKRLSVYTFAFSLRDFFYFAPFARKNASEFHAKTAKRRTQRKDKARKFLPKSLVINLVYNILDDIGLEFRVAFHPKT
jgi:hypothetical protein